MATENLDRPLRILVADCYRDAADSLGLLLQSWGHEARVMYTGPAAVTEATSYRPEVVVTELCLPGLDGLQLAEGLRGQATLIALTGMGRTDVPRRAREAGFDHCFLKPAEPEALYQVLEGVKAGRRRLREDAAHGSPCFCVTTHYQVV